MGDLQGKSRVEKILSEGSLYAGDYVIIVIYFLVIISAGLYAAKQSKRSSISGYFLASRYFFFNTQILYMYVRNMHWIPVGASLFASNIGSEHFIGLAGSGAASGVAIATYEMNAIFILMILGWFFVPVYLSSGIYTMPEYLRLRLY